MFWERCCYPFLAGHWRYSHIATLRCDQVAPGLLGMSKSVSMDSARRAFVNTYPEDCRAWQHTHLQRSCAPLLVTSLTDAVETVVQHYRDRADAENIYDERTSSFNHSRYSRYYPWNHPAMPR